MHLASCFTLLKITLAQAPGSRESCCRAKGASRAEVVDQEGIAMGQGGIRINTGDYRKIRS